MCVLESLVNCLELLNLLLTAVKLLEKGFFFVLIGVLLGRLITARFSECYHGVLHGTTLSVL